MSNLSLEERLNLKKMISNSDEFVDHTEGIRRLKHSGLLLDSMRDIEKLKRSHADLRKEDPLAFEDMCKSAAPTMYKLYTDIFNKLVKDEINLVIMVKLIRVLELIEQGQVDQNEGSAMVGEILKKLYIDSAIRKGNKLDEENELRDKEAEQNKKPKTEAKPISWSQWKKSTLSG